MTSRLTKELKSFKRVSLEPGETQDVSFAVGFEALALFDRALQRVVEPGEFVLMVGANSEELKSCGLTVER